MKKIIFLIFAVCLLVSFILIQNTAIRVLLVVTFILAVYLKASEISYRKYKTNKFPGTIDSPTRNYDNLVIGNGFIRKLKKYYFELTGETLDLTAIGRNFYTDRLILERYFSFLKPGGKAVFCMDCGDTDYFDDKCINRFDMIGLHEVTLWENGIDVRSKEFKKYERRNSWLFLASRFLVRSSRGRDVYKLPVIEMTEIKKFCDIRNFRVLFIIYHADYIKKEGIPIELRNNITLISRISKTEADEASKGGSGQKVGRPNGSERS